MRPWVALLFGSVLAAGASGCRGNCALVESQLRDKECQLRELRDEVDRCGAYNQALEQELRNLRGDGADGVERGIPSYPVRSVKLGRGTGGRDEDGLPGDEALEIHLEPRDPEGQVVRVPGSLHVQAVEVPADGVKRPLSSWDISQGQLQRSWKSGLLSTGYVVVLPWKVWPSTEKVRITAQFRLADGRLFEDDKDVTVRVVPAGQRPAPALESAPGPSIGEEVLPKPRPVSRGRAEPTPAAEILRPVADLSPASGRGSWSAPVQTSPAD